MLQRKNPNLGVGSAKLPRNAFDLSERHLYTQPCGMLLPVYVKELNPDEKVSVDIVSQLQAQTLKGRPFIGMQQQFAAYFVPYRHLYSYWDGFIAGLTSGNIVNSSLLSKSYDPSTLKVPTFRPFSLDMKQFSSNKFDLVDDLGFPVWPSYARLCDMLGYGTVYWIDYNYANSTEGRENFEANAFRWLAYQKIYQDHFLDDRYESRDPACYNVDKFLDYSTGKCLVDNQNCFLPRYAKYNKDFISNLFPSPLFTKSVSSILSPFVGETPFVDDGKSDVRYKVQLEGIPSDGHGTSFFIGAASIRNLFALDKMAQISGRAAKTYRAQMLAHYGVNVTRDFDGSVYCGGFSRDLDSTSVIATSDGYSNGGAISSEPAAFGQQGAFIDNVSNGKVEFESKDFGVFMILSWISPSPRWDAHGIDPFNCKIRSADYYHPEFADLGLQPLYDNYICNTRYVVGGSDLTIGVSPMGVYGWTERYAEYKSSFDKLHGEFCTPVISGLPDGKQAIGAPLGSLSFLTTHSPYTHVDSVNSASPQAILNNPMKLTLADVSIGPDVTNNLVEVEYDGTQATDPFRVETLFRASVIRNMSVSGLPRL